MGDRANVFVKNQYEEGGVYLYTHWGGDDLPFVVQRALARRWRWNQDSYLARIIFCEMVKGSTDEETGYGISTSPPDNEHDIIVVDCNEQHIGFGEPGHIVEWFSFEDYVKMDKNRIRKLYH